MPNCLRRAQRVTKSPKLSFVFLWSKLQNFACSQRARYGQQVSTASTSSWAVICLLYIGIGYQPVHFASRSFLNLPFWGDRCHTYTSNMAAVTEDTLTKVSTDAATDFVQSFYSALQSARPTISSFYSQPSASILFNGNAVADGAAVQDIFMNQMPSTYYEVQSYDCQVLNPSYPTAAGLQPDIQGRPRGGAAAARNMSILVLVSGYVRFGEGKESF
ncbi:hypothetical protein CISG_04920 [Coccidioides immitis RMSCC 3703]|uniref:NTF2 domain-containing protein n=1 Tax=Coccidioides immitis RMSCC 3703 TaxID=454286 RepID=A0A0J8QTG6_COCIT|nr:hypothetical protein CISG_04920 [Coccidioides immitis RMSCC 3703]